MPHVAFVPFTGLRVRQQEMLELGMRMPGLRRRAEALAELPALGLLTLAGMTPPNWTCSFHPSADSDNLLEDVFDTKPSLVAVSALTASVLEAYKFCAAVKDRGVPTVIGGLHVTAMPNEAAQHSTSVCVGDGESSWLQILQDADQNGLKAIYRPKEVLQLSESPTPKFELLNGAVPQRWVVQTQRGCPWACEFCAASRLLGPARFKDAKQVAHELGQVRKRDQSPWVELADDNTFAGRRDSLALLEVLREAKIRYFTESDWMIGEDQTLLDALARSGCVQVLVGIESLTFRHPGMGKKKAELDKMMAAVDRIQAAGVAVNGCFIVGTQGETHASIDRMIDFINQSNLAEVQLTLQTPFPGTSLYKRMKQDAQLLDERDWSFYTLFDVVYQPDQMSVAGLAEGFSRAVASVFAYEPAKKRETIRKEIWRQRRRLIKQSANSNGASNDDR